MGKPSDHITPGALCTCCRRRPATTLARFVARTDELPQDALLWGAATCWECAEALSRVVSRAAGD
jgi:hypothetical protein